MSFFRRVSFSAALVTFGCLGQVVPAGDLRSPSNLPVQPIGPDDLVNISVYHAPELTRTYRVSADGYIALPLVQERVHAAGLAPESLATAVSQALTKDEVLANPLVSITVAEYRSRPVSVTGAVKKPLTFQSYGTTTLLDAIAQADGLTDAAGPSILVTRPAATPSAEAQTTTISVRELMGGANNALNLVLHGGETVRIPEAGKIFVVGNVKRPGMYRMDAQGETTVFKLMALSEGLTPFASRTAYLYRQEQPTGSPTEIAINLQDIMERKTADVALNANDIVYIPDNKRRRVTMTTLDRLATFGAGTVSGVLIWRR